MNQQVRFKIPHFSHCRKGSNYNLTLLDGGNLTAGLVTGQVYPIALKKVVNGGGTVVKLLK